jgi:hypothetical protein
MTVPDHRHSDRGVTVPKFAATLVLTHPGRTVTVLVPVIAPSRWGVVVDHLVASMRDVLGSIAWAPKKRARVRQ